MLEGWETLHFVDLLLNPNGTERLSSIVARFLSGMRTYFDPTGLRTLLRNRLIGEAFGGATPDTWNNSAVSRTILNRRLDNLAVAVDEEPEHSLYSAYAAYKFGARAWMVSSYKELANYEVEGLSSFTQMLPTWNDPRTKCLGVLRDLDLRFADFPEATETIEQDFGSAVSPVSTQGLTSKSDSLREKLRILSPAEWRATVNAPSQCFVRPVSSDSRVHGNTWWYKLQAYSIERIPSLSRIFGYLHDRELYFGLKKPIESIYSFSEVLDFCSKDNDLPLIAKLTKPDQRSEDKTGLVRVRAHGAPYQNLPIAESLIRQAAEYRSNKEVRAWIAGALLGQEAYSLLLCMSKTVCREALLEVHLGEARLEGEFAGVAHEVEITMRRKELEATENNLDLDDSGRSFLVRVWAELRFAYRQTDQFEAAERASVEYLANSIWNVRWPRATTGLRILTRFVLAPLISVKMLALYLLLLTSVLTIGTCVVYGWTFSFNKEGFMAFGDLFHHIFINIFRAGPLGVHGVIPDDTFWKEALDVVSSVVSILVEGFIIATIFRKLMRG